MKRIRRKSFKEKCACWIKSDGEFIRSPAANERFHTTDRYDSSIGPCVLGCKEKPCLTAEEQEMLRQKEDEFMRNAFSVKKFQRVHLPRKFKRVYSSV